jgi:RHS repeat-associated protein
VAGRLVAEQLTGVGANSVAPIDLGSREYKYDLVNNRTQTTDRNERITNYEYDNLNRIKTEAWADGSKTFTYSYDKNGNRLTADDGKIRYGYSYDKTDLLETVDRFDDGNLNPKVRFNYEYDEIGNLTQTDEVVGTAVTTTLYEYDDPRYLNTKITQTGAGLASKAVKFTYNATGENTKIERYLDGLLKVTTDNAYDIYGRLTGIAQVRGITPTNPTGTTISNDSYVLDGLNRLQTQTKGGQVKEIGYDKTDQVQTVTGGAGEAYSYDLNGNRTNGGYTTGVDNRLTSDGTYSYQYDPEGNRQSRTNIVTNAVDEYTWDYRNRLTRIVSKTSITGTITQTVGYTYDVDDQRVSKTVTTGTGSTTEKYYLDGNQIAFVTDGGENQMFHYLYGLNVDQVMAQDSPAGMVWALADRLGSVETLTDGEGVVVDKRTFDSFGRVLSESNPSVSFRYGYTGRERDLESGLDYYRARYYDPANGVFISVDPAGFGAGDTNLYRYVGNNSTNATDPSGEFAILPILGIMAVGALFAGAANVISQDIKILEGSQNEFSWGQFGSSLATGAGFGLAAATSPIVAGGLFAYGAVTGTQHGIEEWNNGNKWSGAFDIASSLLPVLGAKKFAGEISNLPGGFKDAHAAWWNKSAGWAGEALGDSFQLRANKPNNVESFEQIANPWDTPSSSSQSNIHGSIESNSFGSGIPEGWMQLPDGSIRATPSRMLAPEVSRAYRVQGGSRPPDISWERVTVEENGSIKIIPETGKTKQTKLYITFDDPQRARVYLRDNRPDGQIAEVLNDK